METPIGVDHTLPADRLQFRGRMAALGERMSPGEMYELYLRYQLLEKRKVPGLRSLASQHHVRDSRLYLPQRDMGPPSSWDSRHQYSSPHPHGSSSSVGGRRRRGIINLPQQRSSSAEDHRIADFAGPKSLAELKGGKEKKQLHSPVGGQRNPKDDLREGFDTAFQGPKPLSVILKRKREETGGVTSSPSCDDDEVGPKKRVVDGLGGTSVPEKCSAAAAAHSPPAKLDCAHTDKEEREPNEDAGVGVADDDQAVEDQGNGYMECDDMNGVENAGTAEEELLEGSDEEDEDAFARSIGVFLT